MKQGLIDPKKTELLVQFSGDTDFTKIVELTAIPFPTSSWTPADVTTLDDLAKRVADAGVIENGVVEIRGLMISGSVQQNQIFVINRVKSCLCYKIVLSDPLHTTIEFYAFITNWSPSNTVGDKARVAFNLTIDGDIKFYNDNGMIWDGSSSGVESECYYTATSTTPIDKTEQPDFFPWFRVNTQNIDRAGNQVSDQYFTQLVSLIPATGAYNHYPSNSDSFVGDVIAQINAILQPHGITASETTNHLVKLSSPNPFYMGATDADGDIYGSSFDVFGEVPNSCDMPSCMPSEPVDFSATWSQLVSHKRLTFSINGSPPSIFTGLAEVGDDDADINFDDYFSRFGAANRVGDDYPIISTTGSNQCAFRIGFDNESGQAIISARDDSYNPLSTTLELIATDHPDDFATHYFGGSITLHACGISEPA